MPTKPEWLVAWIEGLTRTAFTGTASMTLHLEKGSIARLVVEETAKEIET